MGGTAEANLSLNCSTNTLDVGIYLSESVLPYRVSTVVYCTNNGTEVHAFDTYKTHTMCTTRVFLWSLSMVMLEVI